jgi:type I phosphodiesterase/nucleotide pyrophosphatase
VGTACTGDVGPGGAPSAAPPSTAPSPTSVELARGPLARAACSLPHRELLRIWRGYDPRRSGELQLVPEGPNIVGPGFPHAGAIDTLQDVPLVLYGPGQIRPGVVVPGAVTAADVAPTVGRLVGFGLPDADGRALEDGVLRSAPPPRLVLTVVWDGAGNDVLETWGDAWPHLARLRKGGTWYEHGSVGSSPSTSAPIHATLGTGTFPRRHGLIGNAMRVDGRIVDPWDDGPAYLREPTLADLYDEANGNAPLVGLIGSASLQLGLVGHGSLWTGGDRDVAVLKRRKGYANPETFWGITKTARPYFSFPDYVNDLPPITAYHRVADLLDGRQDGAWLGSSILGLRNGFDTPARVPFETRLIEEVVRREGFGADAVPDLLFVNYKLIDYVGHTWSMNSPQMHQAVRVQDAELPKLVRFLDDAAGRGRWVLVLTADHGSNPDPSVSGAWRIDITKIEAHIRDRFDDADGRPVVDQVQTTQVFLDTEELREGGHSLAEIAASVGRLTEAETAGPGVSPRPGEADSPVFAAVFPSDLMPSLGCLPEARAA